jgi:HEAT repeat protein
MGKDGVEEKVAAIEALRANDALRDTPATALDPLRKALKDRNNFVCSKAAKVAGDLLLRDTIPDLLDAFDRFLKDPVKTDSQCWAKYAIIKALKDLAHDDAAVYLRGIAHIQMEAVWGGKADVAGPLRGACALVLVACSMPRDAILLVLADALADKETGVRVDVARAIAQLPGQDSILMLRVKALAGDKEPAVVGQCLLSLLGTDSRGSIPFVARFLTHDNADLRVEAAAALGECPESLAAETLIARWKIEKSLDMKQAIELSLGVSRTREAREFLDHLRAETD